MGLKNILKLIPIILMTNNCRCQTNSHGSNFTFQEYIKAIPTIDFPLKVSCKNNINPNENLIADSLIKKYGISGAYVYGKFNTTKFFSAIIYIGVADEYIPILKISDSFGNAIDTLTLLKNCGGNEDCYYASSWAEITSNLKITINDTIKTCSLNKLDKIISGSEKMETHNRRLIINDEGKIIEFNK